MPVSPADFEFYSRMTGQPIPNTPAGRMAIAPQVYNMRRGGGGFGRFLRGAAKGALAAGALAGAGALALATGEEMAKTGGEKKAKVTENLTDTGMTSETTPGGQKVTVSATDSSPAVATRDRAESFLKELQAQGAKEREATERARQTMAEDSKTYRGMVQDAGDKVIAELTAGGQPLASSAAEIPSGAQEVSPGAAVSISSDASVYDDPNVLVGVTPDQRAKADAFLANRISHQSVVPQADINVANESTAAQRASLGSPPDPTPVVRQQPSSGVVTTDLSNVAKLDRASMIQEAGATLAEAKALNTLIRERDQTGYKGDTQIPKKHPGGSKRDLDAGIHPGGYISNMAADVEDPIRGGLTASRDLMASMLQRGNVLGAQPNQPAPSAAMPSNRELMSEMLERGNVLPDATEQMSRGDKSYVPTPEAAGPFVSNKGREIGALLQRAQSPKVDANRMQAEEKARKMVGLGNPAFEPLVQKLMGNM